MKWTQYRVLKNSINHKRVENKKAEIGTKIEKKGNTKKFVKSNKSVLMAHKLLVRHKNLYIKSLLS